MRSTLHFKGHPLHPMLIAFPVAFFTGAVASDIVANVTSRIEWAFIGSRLAWAGVVMALIAAVPGFVDFLTIAPPKSTGKSRAAKHGLLNVTVVLLFVVAGFSRGTASMPSITTLALEIVGFGLLGVAGWMGGTLAYRNQFGVDHRYAGAGKWNVETVKAANGLITVPTEGLKIDQMKLVISDDKRIVVGKTETGFVAFDDRCTHRGGSLADGVMICGTVQCPWHGSQFDCKTGAVKAGPAKEGIKAYPVTEQNGRLSIRL
jgi:uncharacterized membrane protein/nitrite reductase/ring-hydroxylating ferredoxin subunit